jgi:hypothetical protein
MTSSRRRIRDSLAILSGGAALPLSDKGRRASPTAIGTGASNPIVRHRAERPEPARTLRRHCDGTP